MYIKLKSIETGEVFLFSADDYHIALKLTPEELDWLKDITPTEDGKGLSGADHRTFALIQPKDDDEMEVLAAWVKEP